MAPYPHCNPETIHSPGTCYYCDLHPDLQAARRGSGRPFSPAEGNGWSGNVAVRAGEVHSHMGATFIVGADAHAPLVEDEDDDAPGPRCNRPPSGFYCKRPRGHSGPCPAWARWWKKLELRVRTGVWWP